MRQDDFLLALAAAAPYEPANVKALRAAQLTDAAAPLRFGRDGVDARTLRLGRLLLQPAAAADASGEAPLPLQAEVGVLRALAAVAEAEQATLGDLAAERAALASGRGAGGPAARLAREFRVEKMALLATCAAALRAQAERSVAAGRGVLPEAAAQAPARAPLPGLGLSRIRGE